MVVVTYYQRKQRVCYKTSVRIETCGTTTPIKCVKPFLLDVQEFAGYDQVEDSTPKKYIPQFRVRNLSFRLHFQRKYIDNAKSYFVIRLM